MATYVLVHGAFAAGWSWLPIVPELEAAGHRVYWQSLTGLGERVHLAEPDVDLETHIADVVNLLRFEELDAVALVGHSYGGMVVRGVADRVPERIAQLVYVDALVPEDGQNAFDLITPEMGAFFRQAARSHPEGWLIPANEAVDDFYAGIVRGRATGHPLRTFEQRIRLTNPAAATIPALYIHCTDKPEQEWPGGDPMIAAVERARAAGWQVQTLPTIHNLMFSMPRELAQLLLEVAAGR